ncbi:MAG: dihydroneopterin aldolase [Ignavibacteriales bacterium]|nr:dihydroneopterin aldolase [Ignavibacteriales bacterium]
MKKLDIIRLHNAVFYAYHGALSDEQSLGGKFQIDVELHCNLTAARKSDNLNDTVNYEKVFSVMQHAVVGRKHFLIESLAEAIAAAILKEFKRVIKIVVRVRKPGAPIHGVLDYIEVEVEKTRG